MTPRHQFQIGPTTFRAANSPEGWVVLVEWWEMGRDLEEQLHSGVQSGPMAREAAEARAERLNAEREASEREGRR